MTRQPLVYVAGPISQGNLAHNVNAGTVASIHQIATGYAPICPMWSVFSAMPALSVNGRALTVGSPGGCCTYSQIMGVDFNMLLRCDHLVRLPGESLGADREVELARAVEIPVWYGVEELIGKPEWFQTVTFTLQGETDPIVRTHTVSAYRECDLVHMVRHELAKFNLSQPDSVGPTEHRPL